MDPEAVPEQTEPDPRLFFNRYRFIVHKALDEMARRDIEISRQSAGIRDKANP
ncbi:MAG: hypothetical protein ACOZF0_10690 [Thermodesulfobacteriota bacterium]